MRRGGEQLSSCRGHPCESENNVALDITVVEFYTNIRAGLVLYYTLVVCGGRRFVGRKEKKQFDLLTQNALFSIVAVR